MFIYKGTDKGKITNPSLDYVQEGTRTGNIEVSDDECTWQFTYTATRDGLSYDEYYPSDQCHK